MAEWASSVAADLLKAGVWLPPFASVGMADRPREQKGKSMHNGKTNQKWDVGTEVLHVP